MCVAVLLASRSSRAVAVLLGGAGRVSLARPATLGIATATTTTTTRYRAVLDALDEEDGYELLLG